MNQVSGKQEAYYKPCCNKQFLHVLDAAERFGTPALHRICCHTAGINSAHTVLTAKPVVEHLSALLLCMAMAGSSACVSNRAKPLPQQITAVVPHIQFFSLTCPRKLILCSHASVADQHEACN